MRPLKVITLDEALDKLPEPTFVQVDGLNLQFTDGQLLWWRENKELDKEGNLVMSNILVEDQFLLWDMNTKDLVFRVRYMILDRNAHTITMKQQMVRTDHLRAYDLIMEPPFIAQESTDSRN